MRLLNVESFRLESYDKEYTIPPYLILSHRWGEDEILFQDLQEVPQDVEIRELRQNLRNMEQRFEKLERLLHVQRDNTAAEVQGNSPEEESFGTLEEGAGQQKDDLADRVLSLPYLVRARKKEKGWNKIYGCCKEAKVLGFSYLWIDTCCINKDSSSELSEAINSMFSWYRNAAVCIAYLDDVSFDKRLKEFPASKWFTRGWTLQELIAPNNVWFYSKGWEFLGLRSTLAPLIASITSIDGTILGEESQSRISDFTVASRLSWASKRKCTRVEDRSYSLLGLFGINLPAIYGEGEEAAFFRLQFEIFKVNPDHSIFAWDNNFDPYNPASHMFSPRVDQFKEMSCVVFVEENLRRLQLRAAPALKHSNISHGIRVWLLIRPYESFYEACLNCKLRGSNNAITISLEKGNDGHFRRPIGRIQEIDCNKLKDKEWFMKETFILYPRNDPTRGKFRDVGLHALGLQINDEQVLESGFQRVPVSSDFPYVASGSPTPLTSAIAYLPRLDAFQDLSSQSMPLRWGGLRNGVYVNLYFNKDKMAAFAMVILRKTEYGIVRVNVAIIDSHTVNVGRARITAGAASNTLTSGWHVFVRGSENPGHIACLHLSVKPVTPFDPGV